MTISVTAMTWLIYVATGLVVAAPVLLIIFWWLEHKEDKLW